MIPLLLLGHFIADFPAQTDWIFARKLQGWPGLLMHGGIVLVAQGGAVASGAILSDSSIQVQQIVTLALVTFGMSAIHTVQDYAKIRYGDSLFKQPLIPYVLDQLLHALLIVIAAPRLAEVIGDPSDSVSTVALIATGAVLVTWTYYITWRVIVGLADPYPVMWRWPGKLERLLAYAAGLLGMWWLAPLAIILRLAVAGLRGLPLRGEKYFWPDAILGIVTSSALGYAVLLIIRL